MTFNDKKIYFILIFDYTIVLYFPEKEKLETSFVRDLEKQIWFKNIVFKLKYFTLIFLLI